MKYISTRGNYKKVDSAEAIRLGMVPAGGLFVPETIPRISEARIENMKNKSYQEIAYQILHRYLTDYQAGELKEFISKAYQEDNFPVSAIAPVKKLDADYFILELWHGPTAAFKDMALQLMPYLLTKAVTKCNINKELVILVATSGDTGTAALEGFKNVEGVKIVVFYPEDGVSKIQEAQMTTVEGDNTVVVAVEGNFDDCQNAVKKVFGDKDLNQSLAASGYQFSSANSINWGRLVPQIVYYFSAYAHLLRENEIKMGDKIEITVPTGNFGNILSAYYAYRMGLPVNQFICASNENNILTDFIETGVYDIRRQFKKTISPSMDILISSNLERFLFEITDHNFEKVKKWYQQLKEKGKFEIDSHYQVMIQEIFTGKFADEKESKTAIKNTFESYNYAVDPHTAVGIKAFHKHIHDKKGENLFPVIIDSTANPYKFSKAVIEAIQGDIPEKGDFELLNELKKITGMDIHRCLKNLEAKKIRHQRVCSDNEIEKEIRDILDINQEH